MLNTKHCVAGAERRKKAMMSEKGRSKSVPKGKCRYSGGKRARDQTGEYYGQGDSSCFQRE